LEVKRSLKNYNIFIRFMVSYLCMLMISVIIGNVTYNWTLSMIKNSTVNDILYDLESNKNVIDARLQEVENIITHLTLDPNLLPILNTKSPLSNPDYYKISMFFERVKTYNLTNSFIDNFYIYFKNSNVMISPSKIVSRVPDYYENNFRYEKLEYKEWYEKLFNIYHNRSVWPAVNVVNENVKTPYITYIQTIPIGNFDNYKGVVMVLFNENKFFQNLNFVKQEPETCTYIYDDLNNIVTSFNLPEVDLMKMPSNFTNSSGFQEISMNMKNYIAVYTISNYNNWTYVGVIPTSVFDKKLSYIRHVYITAAILVLLFGLAISVYLSYRNSKPIMDIINKLRISMEMRQQNSENGYDFITSSIMRLVNDNTKLKERLDEQVPLLRVSFFERLLRGDFNSKQEVETVLSQIDCPISGDGYIVVLMSINSYNGEIMENFIQEINFVRIIITDIITQTLGNKAFLHNIGDDKIAVVLCLDSVKARDYKSHIEDIFKNIINCLYYKYNISISSGAGRQYDTILGVSSSFQEASRALENKPLEESRQIVWYEELPKRKQKYYYPIDLELRLIKSVKSGDKNAVLSILEDIYKKNYTGSDISEAIIKQIVYEVCGTVNKIRDDIIIEDRKTNKIIDNYLNNIFEHYKENYREFTKIFNLLCDYVNNKKEKRNIFLRNSILQYIEDNYSNSELCLFDVSSKFNFSEKYLSQYFKGQTGENFTAYVEKIRMKHAGELLSNSTISINDIASKVGYSNINTFYKAFKRFYGVSPNLYRKELLNKNTTENEYDVQI